MSRGGVLINFLRMNAKDPGDGDQRTCHPCILQCEITGAFSVPSPHGRHAFRKAVRQE